jgi:pyruvate dehydrogenase E1 component alpha subunit
MKREQRVSVVFFGDGAVDEGSFYESLNFAALHKLPLVFVCENNFYATNSPQKARQVNPEIYQLAGFFKLPSSCLDGNDVLEVYQAAGKYIAAARRGQGPALIEARTYRWKTHVGPETDIEKNFRDKVEVEEWFKKCPLKKFRESTLGQGLLKEPDLEEIEARVKKEIAAALAFALKSPYPKAEALLKDVY